MLKLRILSACLGIPVLLFLVWSGGWLLTAGVAILAGLGWREFTTLVKTAGFQLQQVFGGVLVLLFPIAAYLESSGIFSGLLAHLPVAVLILTAVAFIISFPNRSLSDIAVTSWGILYIGGLFSYWILLRESNGGFYLVIWALSLTWAYDTGAYFVGRRWGKHRPWPNLSPNKTVEGVVGGLLFSSITSLLLTRTFVFAERPVVGAAAAILLGLVVGAVAQFGDLIESGIKRQVGVKDSGSFIPGHGGILDRFDSLLLVMPVVYFWVGFGYLGG